MTGKAHRPAAVMNDAQPSISDTEPIVVRVATHPAVIPSCRMIAAAAVDFRTIGGEVSGGAGRCGHQVQTSWRRSDLSASNRQRTGPVSSAVEMADRGVDGEWRRGQDARTAHAVRGRINISRAKEAGVDDAAGWKSDVQNCSFFSSRSSKSSVEVWRHSPKRTWFSNNPTGLACAAVRRCSLGEAWYARQSFPEKTIIRPDAIFLSRRSP